MGTGEGDASGAGFGVNLGTLSMVLILLILLGLLVQGSRIDEPSTLHSLNDGLVEDAVLLENETKPKAKSKPAEKSKKS